MPGWLERYARWLHMQWPAGRVEKLPRVAPDGSTGVAGVFIVGDLTGVPLLKFALDSGARTVAAIALDPALRTDPAPEGTPDIAILGGGVAGMAAAVEAKRRGLSFVLIEAEEAFFTIANFPRRKPIFTFPGDMTPAGALQVRANLKETLLEELRRQTDAAGIHPRAGHAARVERSGRTLTVHLTGGETLVARRVLIALGRAGDYRRLGVPGESLDKVTNRLHDPNDYSGQRALVVGGGDTALETALALVASGAVVTLAHRGSDFARARPESVEALATRTPGPITVRLETSVTAIHPNTVELRHGEATEMIPNDVVFTMLGRDAPLDFFRRSRLPIANEMTPARWAGLAAFLLACAGLYNWKSGGRLDRLFQARGWFPYDIPTLLQRVGGGVAHAAATPGTLLGTLAISAAGPSFWYTLVYSLVVVVFGIRRIRRRRTPYVTAQTLCLMAVQVIPLFLLPELILPLLDRHGLLPRGLADALFPVVSYGHGREFWRAYGFILAWPLDVYNLFTHEPLWWWIAIGFVQTCVLIPLGIWRFGKGFYCGWICSCGALAETLGDTHRHKMPHGPGWNRLNLLGQGVLALATLMLMLRILGWAMPDGNWADQVFEPLKEHYKWTVDVFLAGVLGYGLYFWMSGRMWCRFACPLAALMHIYARFSRFRILAEKPKCISCGACTTSCHQGIDVMSFANKGLPMADPECVRCSACVHVCPTGVLSFGQVDRHGTVISLDSLLASPVQMREGAPRPPRRVMPREVR
jgi:NosR/NirI family transcriptional regulator, nitrous oxide reductase regulator